MWPDRRNVPRLEEPGSDRAQLQVPIEADVKLDEEALQQRCLQHGRRAGFLSNSAARFYSGSFAMRHESWKP
jgi:hypothetical protein